MKIINKFAMEQNKYNGRIFLFVAEVYNEVYNNEINLIKVKAKYI